MNKILVIGQKIETITEGANVVDKANQIALEELFPNNVYYLNPEQNTIAEKIVFGITNTFIEKALKLISTQSITTLFLSRSIFGRIARAVKKTTPEITVICNFHNIERCYARAFLKSSGLRAVPFYTFARYWEGIAVKYSDKCIVLNKRDADLFNQIYHREADAIVPVCYSPINADIENHKENNLLYDYLFIGSAFFANINGCRWFIENVLPNVTGKLLIAGKGMDGISFDNSTKRVEVIGYVENLAQLYHSSRIVVLPIFEGSGMKTKTAEALMYGKPIVSTEEGLIGYDVTSPDIYKCQTSAEFIEALNNLKNSTGLSKDNIRTFEVNHSIDSHKKRIRLLLTK